MVGLEGRTLLLKNLSGALSRNPQFFGQDARPGNIVGKGAVVPVVDPSHPRDSRLPNFNIRFPGGTVEGL